MKNIYKSLLALGLIFSLNSCEDEQDLMFLQPEATFEILSPVSGEGAVLNPDTPLNPGVSLTWSKADFGTPTEITYSVEIDKSGDNFDTPVVITSTTNNYVTITSDVLNSASVGSGLIPFTEGGLEIRIKATVGTTASNESYSNVITYLVTPYSTDLPKLAVPGNHQGWNPPTAPTLAASAFGETDYEGYVWLDGGHKFVAPDPSGAFNWGNTDWGDDGTFSGVLVETGESDCVATAGYYRIQANTTTLTYSETLANWAVTGAATPNGWPDPAPDHDMTYDNTTKKWSVVLTLSAGEFKFRANNAWDLNLGGDSNGDEYMDYGGPNLSVATAGTYLIELDLSNPRQYTYTLTAQ